MNHAHLFHVFLLLFAAAPLATIIAQQASPAASTTGLQDSNARRRSGLVLAQIPTPASPGAIPGQNPNTVRPPVGGSAVRNVPRPGAPAGSSAPPAPRPPPTPARATPVPPQAGVPAASPVPPPPPNVTTPTPEGGDEEMVDIQWVNFPMPQILLEYERLTGKKIVRDINVESVSFSIETTGQLPKTKAVEFIEKSLLLNGYAFIPAGENIVKFLNVAALKPGSEGPDIFTSEDAMPQDEKIVTFVQPLQYLEAEDLKKSIIELVPPHAYQVITPLPNARGVIITDNTNTIRYILRLIEHLDVEPSRTDKKSFQLLRSSAEKIADSLREILDIEGKKGGSSGGGSSGGGRNYANNTPPPIPAAQPANGAAGVPGARPGAAAAAAAAGGGAPQATAIPPKIIPIPRTNKLLVIARPIDLAYIESLIEELDGAAELRNFISRPLKFMLATDALPIIKDAINRGNEDDGGGASGTSGGGTTGGTNTANNSGNNRSGDFSGGRSGGGFGNSSSGIGGGGIGGGGSSSFGGGGGGGLSSLGGEKMQPTSIVVSKTLIIADPVANEIFASGPPDHLEALNEVLDQLDRRPRSVVINAVIGELTLGDTKDFGVDYLFRPQKFGGGKNFGTVGGIGGTSKNVLDPSNFTTVDKFPDASGLALFGTINDQVNLAVTALTQNKDFKILSRPTLYTLNNKPASIETGLKVPVPSSTLGSYSGGSGVDPNTGGNSSGFVSNIQYQDISLRLDVAPLIHSDNELMLQVKQVNATQAGTTKISGNDIPNISNQGLETTIMVKNNATVLLGGLISETVDKERSGIPILKDIPIIKYITSSTKNTKSRRELLVFIQPRIVTGEGDDPTSPKDSAGASPLGDEMRQYLSAERNNPDIGKTQVKRSRAAAFFRRFFH